MPSKHPLSSPTRNQAFLTTSDKVLDLGFGPLEQISSFSYTNIQNPISRTSIPPNQDRFQPVVETLHPENRRLFPFLDPHIWTGVVVICDLGVDFFLLWLLDGWVFGGCWWAGAFCGIGGWFLIRMRCSRPRCWRGGTEVLLGNIVTAVVILFVWHLCFLVLFARYRLRSGVRQRMNVWVWWKLTKKKKVNQLCQGLATRESSPQCWQGWFVFQWFSDPLPHHARKLRKVVGSPAKSEGWSHDRQLGRGVVMPRSIVGASFLSFTSNNYLFSRLSLPTDLSSTCPPLHQRNTKDVYFKLSSCVHEVIKTTLSMFFLPWARLVL